MTTEQKEAVKDLVEFNNKFDCGKYRKAIETVLNLIQEQEAELKKKDKIIDELAKAFKQDDVRSVQEIKQYFEKQAKEKGE